MADLTVTNLPDEAYRALELRAVERGHSVQAEVRVILADAVLPDDHPSMGQALAALGKQLALSDEDVDHLAGIRSPEPAAPPTVA